MSGFLPCMLPVLPLTIKFLRGRNSKSKRPPQKAKQGEETATNNRASIVWKEPLLYWLGILLCYLILGALAILTGSSFNAIVRNPYFLLGLGIFFMLLALSSLDFFSFQKIFSQLAIVQTRLDALWQRASQIKARAFGTLTLGFLAGILVSACASPVLISMFLFLSKSSVSNMAPLWEKVLRGALYSGVFGLGISLPLLLMGILSLRLPKTGRWSVVLQTGLAFLIFMVGVYEFSNGVQILRRQYTGISVQKVSEQREEIGDLLFYRDFYYGLSQAASANKPIFIDFYGDWCSNCKIFDRTLTTDQPLIETLQKIVLVKIYDTDEQFQTFQKNEDFAELKYSLPLYAVLHPDGTLFWKTVDYQDTKGMRDAIHELELLGKD